MLFDARFCNLVTDGFTIVLTRLETLVASYLASPDALGNTTLGISLSGRSHARRQSQQSQGKRWHTY
jgi:hypothetical protein